MATSQNSAQRSRREPGFFDCTLVALALFLFTCSTAAQAPAKNSCLECHSAMPEQLMVSPEQHAADIHSQKGLTCVSCHGGNASVQVAGSPGTSAYAEARDRAHVLPRDRDAFRTSANPERSYTAFLKEDVDFVRFVNPGDLRAAPTACARSSALT